MKLSIFEMQALEFGVKSVLPQFTPWYSDGSKLFTVDFLSGDSPEFQVWTAETAFYPAGLKPLDRRFRPALFWWIKQYLEEANVSSALELSNLITDWLPNRSKADAATSTNGFGSYKADNLTQKLIIPGLPPLHGARLETQEYDLVGFQQNSK